MRFLNVSVVQTWIGKHTSELQSHSEISYAVFCLKKKKIPDISNTTEQNPKRQAVEDPKTHFLAKNPHDFRRAYKPQRQLAHTVSHRLVSRAAAHVPNLRQKPSQRYDN